MNKYDEAADSLDLTLLNDLMRDVAKPVFGEWKNWKLEDFQECYAERYAMMSRSEVKKAKKIGGQRFYQAAFERGIVDQVFPKSKITEWKKIGNEGIERIYHEKFAGETRVELMQTDEGRKLYDAMHSRGLRGIVEKAYTNWSEFELEDFKRYNEENYANMSRVEIKKDTENGGRRFYLAVVSRGFADEVFPSSKRHDWSEIDVEGFKAIYKENYDGMTPKQLKDDLKNGGREFYRAINNRSIQGKIITNSRNRWKGWELDDFKEHYAENYAGMQRMEVRNLDPDGMAFYRIVFRRKLMDKVFPLNVRDMWKSYSAEELEKYSKENYAGMKRSHLERHEDAEIRSFFLEVTKRGIIDTVLPNSRKPNGYWKDIDNIRTELEVIVTELERVPLISDIVERNVSLSVSIQNYHGGYTAVCETLGIEPALERQANGYWTREKTLEIAKELYLEYGGKIPTGKVAKELGLGSFMYAANKYFRGVGKLNTQLNLENENSSARSLLEDLVGELLE